MSDDFFITLRYCDNVLAGNGPIYNPGEHTEGFTHFLWFVLLTAGRALGLGPILLGKYLELPAFVGTLILLIRLSGRLFPERGGLWRIPVAALGWALHEDAQLYAFGGLETMFFCFLLLLGFWFACTSEHPRRVSLAAWAYGVSCLVRPEGLLFASIAGLYVLWRDGGRSAARFALVCISLVGPLTVFRLLYYGYPFPNPYYAKSGGLAYWSQGWSYLSLYFGCYFVLLASIPGVWVAARDFRSHSSRSAGPLLLAAASSAASILYVTRLGGDYMFARFFLPITPWLLLLCESLAQRPRHSAWRLALTGGLLGLILLGIVLKHVRLSADRPFHGITDEPTLHSFARLDRVRGIGQALQICFAGTQAKVLLAGGQASLAYYAQFPIAVESYGLTDASIAHSPIQHRGRPGHEKFADARYIDEHEVNFKIYYHPMRHLPQFVRVGFRGPGGSPIEGEILVYNRKLMDVLKTRPEVQFFDFPLWLQQIYLPTIGGRSTDRLIREFNYFERFYFNHNADPEGLRLQLRAALAARGIREIPRLEIRASEDSGHANWSPSAVITRVD